jgi:hypothetical protein
MFGNVLYGVLDFDRELVTLQLFPRNSAGHKKTSEGIKGINSMVTRVEGE